MPAERDRSIANAVAEAVHHIVQRIAAQQAHFLMFMVLASLR
jgi:hypothetical protein